MENNEYTKYQGDNEWFSDRVIDENTLMTYDTCSGSNMPSLKLAYNYIQECKKIVDLGCGTGRTIEWLRKKGHDAIGITFNNNEVQFAKKNNISHIYYGDMQNLQYENDSFDAVLSFESIEHVPNIYKSVCEIHRILKPNGKAVIFIPHQDWIECPYHIIVPTIRQFKWLIHLSGLTLESIHEWGNEQATYFIKK